MCPPYQCIIHSLINYLLGAEGVPAQRCAAVASEVQRAGSGTPPGHEDGKTDSLKELGQNADADSLQRTPLNQQLADECGSAGRGEDESAEVGSALVAESASGVDESTDTVGLEGGTDESAAPCGDSTSGLAGTGKLLLAVGYLGALVSLAEERGEDGELGGLVEDGAKGDGGRLNWGKIVKRHVCGLVVGGFDLKIEVGGDSLKFVKRSLFF